MPISRRMVLTGFGASGLVLPAAAQSPAHYPAQPIKLVVPFPAGGVNDVVARIWTERMSSALGAVVVENQGGAGGSLGAAAVARAQPDGYTLLVGGVGSQIINPLASSRKLYDPVRDFEGVVLLATAPVAVAVSAALPVKSLPELVAYAKANPGRLGYGSAGVGSLNHLTGELLKSLAGLPDITHIPYRGAGPAITDLVSNQIPMMLVNVTGQVIELHQSGRIRLLCVAAPRRGAALQDVPTSAEAGFPKLLAQNFFAIYAPAGTPLPVRQIIADRTREAMQDATFREKLTRSGFEPFTDFEPAAAAALIREEIERWSPIIQQIQLKLD